MITPSEICIILYILQKLNSIKNYYTIALLFIQTTVHFPVLKGVSPFCSLFFCSPKITQSRPEVFSVNGSIICNRLHFWRHFDVIGSIICNELPFWRPIGSMRQSSCQICSEEQLVMVNYACGFSQSKTGKYFEWIINLFNDLARSYTLKFHELAIAAPFIYALENKSKIVVVVSLLSGAIK